MLRAVKRVLVLLLGVFGLSVSGLAAFMGLVWWSSEGTGIDGGAGSWVMRSLFHDGPRYFELTVNLEVEGQPFEIKRVMECEPYFMHRFGVGYFLKRWYMKNEAITHRLPDGSGIVVVSPRLCNSFAPQQPPGAPVWGAFPDLPEDFVPLILWTANADNPDVLEGYHSLDAVERSGARIGFQSITLRNDSRLEPSVSANEFGVWNNASYEGYVAGNRSRPILNYRGFYLVTVTEEDWKAVPGLDASLNANRDSGFLELSDQLVLNESFQMSTGYIRSAVEGNTAPRQHRSPSPFHAASMAVVDDMQGFRQRADSLLELDQRKGIILYHRVEAEQKNNLDGIFYIDGEQITWPSIHKPKGFYSKRSGSIYSIKLTGLSFHKANTGS